MNIKYHAMSLSIPPWNQNNQSISLIDKIEIRDNDIKQISVDCFYVSFSMYKLSKLQPNYREGQDQIQKN